eukprot:TRINITY_DN1744_c0_g1_i1.p1 TRINITY_DN1744_c0_g1~~TRINITY_DN1744_c0_g1_i1.p1  ORF type:complete len:246 (-),score=59.30 TRINITY_DN1744_c0_g1_i1:61-798(-)
MLEENDNDDESLQSLPSSAAAHEHPSFNTLEKRLRSFTAGKWPHPVDSESDFTATPFSLAFSGFFLEPRGKLLDRCVCFSCGLALVGWEPADDPIVEHRIHGKNCAYLKTIPDVQGVPASVLATITASASSSQDQSAPPPPLKKMRKCEEEEDDDDDEDGDESHRVMEAVKPQTLLEKAKAEHAARRKKLMSEYSASALQATDKNKKTKSADSQLDLQKLFLHDIIFSTLFRPSGELKSLFDKEL